MPGMGVPGHGLIHETVEKDRGAGNAFVTGATKSRSLVAHGLEHIQRLAAVPETERFVHEHSAQWWRHKLVHF